MKYLFVAGDPISQSLSPVMHKAALIEAGLDDEFTYVSKRIDKPHLPKLVEELNLRELIGGNLTHPLKQAMIPYLSALSPEAESIGAVNTVLATNDGIQGFNTDAPGFLQFIKNQEIPTNGKNILILGAGGAALAVAYTLVNNGAKLSIYNRTPIRGRQLINKLIKFGPITLQSEITTQDIDIIINTTSVGLNGIESPLPKEFFNSDQIVIDLIYNPIETPFLQLAKSQGAMTINGLMMFVFQGVLAFEIFTNVKPDVDVMLETVLSVLKGEEH